MIFSWKIWAVDATQAYLQSDELIKDSYARLRVQFRTRLRGFVLIFKLMCGLKESRAYWIYKYIDDWYLSVIPSTTLGVCLMYTRSQQGELEGMPAVTVDEFGCTGTKKFLQADFALHSHYKSSRRQLITANTRLRFGGVHIQYDDASSIVVNQTEYIETALREKKLPANAVPTITQVTVAVAIGWVVTPARCDIVTRVSLLNQVVELILDIRITKLLKETTDIVLDSKEVGFILSNIDTVTTHVAGYGDVSLAGNADLSSKMGGKSSYSTQKGHANTLRWFSHQCPRVVASIVVGNKHLLRSDQRCRLRNSLYTICRFGEIVWDCLYLQIAMTSSA